MTVKCVVRLGPEDRVVVCIKAVGTHEYFAVSNRRLGDGGSIRGGDKIFAVEEESPDPAVCCTNGPYKNGFSGKTIVNPKFDILPSTRHLSKSSFVSTTAIFDKFLLAVRTIKRRCRQEHTSNINMAFSQGLLSQVEPEMDS